LVIETRVSVPLPIKSRTAASGESCIAVPLVDSAGPKIITFKVIPVAGFVTAILSPGRNRDDFAKRPWGNTPSPATEARPSMDGFVVIKFWAFIGPMTMSAIKSNTTYIFVFINLLLTKSKLLYSL
jgi:hypothetical protein